MMESVTKKHIAFRPSFSLFNDAVLDKLDECNAMLANVKESNAELYQRLLATWRNSMDTLERLQGNQASQVGHSPGALIIYTDFAPYSFTWSGGGFFGGLIFHGAGENYTVHLDSNFVGWSLHT